MNIDYTIHNHDVEITQRTCIDYLSQKEKNELIENGIIVLPQRLDLYLVDELRNLTDELTLSRFDGELKSTYSSKKFAGQYIRDPHKEKIRFYELLDRKYPFVDIIRSLMGPRIVIRSYSIRTTYPQSKDGTMWHSDQRSMVSPRPVLFTEPNVLTLSIYLDGADREMGLFSVVHGSHKWECQPTEAEFFKELENQTDYHVDEGGVVLFNSAIWHRGGQNVSDKKRRVIIIHFAPIFCKQASYEDVVPSKEYNDLIADLYSSHDEQALELLGYNGLKKYPGFM